MISNLRYNRLFKTTSVRLAQLCAIVNLLGAQQGLSKAVLLVKGKPTKDYVGTPSLKEYYNVMQNAKCVLDTMKFVYASLEKVCGCNVNEASPF